MAKIKRIMVHCTGEPSNEVRRKSYYFWLFFKKYHWKHFRYHRVIYQDGSWSDLQPIPAGHKGFGIISDSTMANGCKGANLDSLHVAYVGGIDPLTNAHKDTRTEPQKAALLQTIKEWKQLFGISEVIGHRDWPGVKKSCPCFDARKEYANV
jgi:N-acetylmuramoyl-L-alanine amidase